MERERERASRDSGGLRNQLSSLSFYSQDPEVQEDIKDLVKVMQLLGDLDILDSRSLNRWCDVVSATQRTCSQLLLQLSRNLLTRAK